MHLMLKFAAVSVCLFAFAEKVPAQSATGTPTPETGVVLTKLSPPAYPPLARQARITGDVKMQIVIRRDGSVESAEVIDGHPMLKQAALDSAKNSTFECEGCSDPVIPYLLTYTFALGNDCRLTPDCQSEQPRSPEVTQSVAQVTVTADPLCTCDPESIYVRKKIRSAKCLYLWRCGFGDLTDAPVH